MNVVKELLLSGKTVIGATASPSSDTAMLADSGLDFLLFDTQHAAVEVKQLSSFPREKCLSVPRPIQSSDSTSYSFTVALLRYRAQFVIVILVS